MKVTNQPRDWDKHKPEEGKAFSYSYRNQFEPEKFAIILKAYTLFLPLLFEDLRLTPERVRLVGRGFSGTVFVLPLAVALGCKVTIVRKPDSEEESHGQRVEGIQDKEYPWIFIDDCIDSGATLSACEEALGSEPCAKVLWGTTGWHPAEKENGMYILSHYVTLEDE